MRRLKSQISTTTEPNASPRVPEATSEPAPAVPQAPAENSSQQNAVNKAKMYLDAIFPSYEGLITQLEYEHFSHADAVYGADHCNANWNEQAAKKAKIYLEALSLSRQGLIDQLLYDKFTQSQAEYGADNCGANW